MKQEHEQVTITAAGLAVEKARDRYRETLELEQEARKNTTAALNALNQATREFDRLVTEFRRTMPQGADWNRPETVGAGR